MKHIFSICAFILFGLAAIEAQVASHTPSVFTPAPSKSAQSVAPLPALKPVARVNGSVLTSADLTREEYTIFPYANQHNGVPKELEPQIRAGAMKMMIFEELIYQEALRRKMTVPPAKMQRAETDFRKQFANPQEFDQLMQVEFQGSTQLLREKIRRSLLIESFLKSEVDSKSAVSPAEVKAFYDKNPARFEHPETYTFQTISVLPPAKPTPGQAKEGRTRVEQALKQAKATKTAEEFGMLAEKLSDDDYRVMMGQHKPMPVDQLTPQVMSALKTMKVGDVSGVIQIEQAYTIVRLGQHTPAGKAKFEEVKTQLQKEVQLAKTNQIRAALDQKLRQNAKIEVL